MSSRLLKIIILISSLGLIFSIWLIINDFYAPGFCPKFIKIPACYIVFICFAFVLISCFIKGRLSFIIFLTGSISGLGLAVWFSYRQLIGLVVCPVFYDIKIPLCYISFIIFLIITILYMFRNKLK